MRKVLIVAVLMLAVSGAVAGRVRADDGHGAINGTGTLVSTVDHFAGLAAPVNNVLPYQADWHAVLTGLIAGNCVAAEQGSLTLPNFLVIRATGSAFCTGTINGQSGSFQFDFVSANTPGFGGSFRLRGQTGLEGVSGYAKYQGANSSAGANLTYTATIFMHGGDGQDN
jgi:hypothetical protein